MRAIVVLFTRDLRVRDHPALAAAARDAERVVPLFVHDERIRAAGFVRPNRAAFLLECLADLGDALRQRGAPLVTRQGDVVHETMRVADAAGAEAVYLSADVSAYAAARERRLRDACVATRRALVSFPGVTIVPPGELRPGGGDHFRVFTHYWRRWVEAPRRPRERAPARLTAVADVAPGRSPARETLAPGSTSPELPPGGASAGERRLEAWLRRGLAGYAERHDVLDDNGTSRLSPYLHFGCVSPLAVAERAVGRPRSPAGDVPRGVWRPRSPAGDVPRGVWATAIGSGSRPHPPTRPTRGRTTPRPRSPAGGRGAPGTRWWTPAGASSPARAGPALAPTPRRARGPGLPRPGLAGRGCWALEPSEDNHERSPHE